MRAEPDTLHLDRTLWVQYGGVDAHADGNELVLTARNDLDPEEVYCKVFNHFGRVLKLFTFEQGRWVDAATGAPPGPFDESLAGRITREECGKEPDQAAAATKE